MKHHFKTFFSYFLIIFSFFLLSSCNNKKKEYKTLYAEAKTLLEEQEDIVAVESAIKKYEELIAYTMMALDGKYHALKILGIELIQQKKYLKAIGIFEQMKKIKPEKATPYYYIGLCYGNHAKLQQLENTPKNEINLAEKNLLIAKKLAPADANIDFALGILYGFIKKDLNLGLQYLQQAKQTNPKDLQTLFGLANLHLQTNNKAKAIALYKKIITLADKNPQKKKQAQENLDQLLKN